MELRTTYRAMLMAERMNNAAREASGKEPAPFTMKTEEERAYYYYATIETCNPGLMTFDEFLANMDDKSFRDEIARWIDRENKEKALVEGKKKGKASR